MNVLTPKEVVITQMALSCIIEDLEKTSKDPRIPFEPSARKDMADMISTAKSAHAKLALTSGHEVKVDPYQEGDETQFLTKES